MCISILLRTFFVYSKLHSALSEHREQRMRQVVAYKGLKTIENHSTFKAQNAGVCPVLAPVEGFFSNRNIGQFV